MIKLSQNHNSLETDNTFDYNDSKYSNDFKTSKTGWENVIYEFVQNVNIPNGYETEYDVSVEEYHHLHKRRKRQAETTISPGHRGSLKIIQGIEWHNDLLNVTSDAFVELEAEVLEMVSVNLNLSFNVALCDINSTLLIFIIF